MGGVSLGPGRPPERCPGGLAGVRVGVRGVPLAVTLEIHRHTHTGEKPFQCTLCPKSFGDRSNLRTHQSVHTGWHRSQGTGDWSPGAPGPTIGPGVREGVPGGPWTYLGRPCAVSDGERGERPRGSPCPGGCPRYPISAPRAPFRTGGVSLGPGRPPERCPGGLTGVRVVVRGGPRRPGEKPYNSKQCGKRFPLAVTLEIHRHTHTGENPFQCTLCPKIFGDGSNLRTHQSVHTGEKRYSCSFCKKEFRLLQHMRNHKLAHKGAKPHQCDECGQTFAAARSLENHKANHKQPAIGEKETPYPCRECGSLEKMEDSERCRSSATPAGSGSTTRATSSNT